MTTSRAHPRPIRQANRRLRGQEVDASLIVLGHGNDVAVNALLTDQEYRGRMAGAAGVLLGTCDEILRRLLTFAEE